MSGRGAIGDRGSGRLLCHTCGNAIIGLASMSTAGHPACVNCIPKADQEFFRSFGAGSEKEDVPEAKKRAGAWALSGGAWVRRGLRLVEE